MSHFIVNLILPQDEVSMEKIEEMLDPYDEEKEVEPYIYYYKRDAKKLYTKELDQLKKIIDCKNENINPDACKEHYENMKKMTVEEYYDYYFEGKKRDGKGNILSTYNPDSKWDWWQVGGRFAGWLLNLSPEKASTKIEKNRCKIEQAIKEKKIPFALILPSGKWVERGKMGWWAEVREEMPEKEWGKKVLEYYRKYPGHIIVQIDCHI